MTMILLSKNRNAGSLIPKVRNGNVTLSPMVTDRENDWNVKNLPRRSHCQILRTLRMKNLWESGPPNEWAWNAGGAQKQDIVPQKRKPVGNKPIKTKQKKEKPVPKSSKVKPKPSAKPKVPKPPAKRTNTSRKKDGKSKGTADIRSFFS